jgi:hypothetical protein
MKTKLLKDRGNAAMFASVSHLFTCGAIEMGSGYCYINYSVLMRHYIRQGMAWCLFDDRHYDCHKVYADARHLEAVIQIKKYLTDADQDIRLWRNSDMSKIKEAVAYLLLHDARAKAFARYHEEMVLNERELCQPREYGWRHSVLGTALAVMLHDALWDPERIVREQAMLNMFPKIMNNIVSPNQGDRDVFHDRILPALVE